MRFVQPSQPKQQWEFSHERPSSFLPVDREVAEAAGGGKPAVNPGIPRQAA